MRSGYHHIQMKIISASIALLIAGVASTAASTTAATSTSTITSTTASTSTKRNDFAYETKYGYQSGRPFTTSGTSTTSPGSSGAVDSASYGGSLYYDSTDNLIYITGSTYWSYWDTAGSTSGSGFTSNTNTASYLKKSDCFFGVLEPRPATLTTKASLKLIFAERFGSASIPEACSNIALTSTTTTTGGTTASPVSKTTRTTGVITAGHTPEGGFLTSLRPLGSLKSKVYGFLLKINLQFERWPVGNDTGSVKSVTRIKDGGILLNDMVTQYPAAVTTNTEGTNEEIYLVTLASAFSNENDYFTSNGGGSGNKDYRPDLTTGGGVDYPQYGKSFNIVLEKIIKRDNEEMEYERRDIELYGGAVEEGGIGITLKRSWGQVFSLDNLDFASSSSSSSRMLNDNDGVTFHNTFLRVADLKYIPYTDVSSTSTPGSSSKDDVLILAGTTNGVGEAFGGSHKGQKKTHSIRKTHGFVTKLTPSGEILQSTPIHVNGESVSIKGLCYGTAYSGTGGNTKMAVDLFVVGETTGKLDANMEEYDLTTNGIDVQSKHAFISKIDLSTMNIQWTRQFGTVGGNDAIGYGCAVSTVNHIVYLTGNIAINANINFNTGGSDSLKILQEDYRTSDGRIRTNPAGGNDVFVAILDTENGETNVVRQFGTSEHDSVAKGDPIAVDLEGNGILLGNTRGSLVRWRGDGALSVDEDPSDVFVVSIARETGDTVPIAEFDRGSGGEGGGGGGGDGAGNIDDETEGVEEGFGLAGFEILAITVASTIVFATMLYIALMALDGGNGGAMGKESEKIMKYVKDFHDDDVTLHIRHSATGGLHGIYSPQKHKEMDQSLETQTALGVNQDYFTYDNVNGGGNGGGHGGGNNKPVDNELQHEKRVLFKDDIEMDGSGSNASTLTSNSSSNNKKSKLKEEDEKVHDALDSVEADFNFRNNQTMVQQQQQQRSQMHSTPIFDGSDMSDLEGNFGLSRRTSTTPMPPPRAFQTGDNDNGGMNVGDKGDDEWETEIL